MARPSYITQGIVVRKTLLKESDLILEILAQDGSRIDVVAKGARKPQGSFSSRLELFSVVELHCIEGKSLDIVKEARLLQSNAGIRESFERTMCATVVAELVSKAIEKKLPHDRLFDMTKSVLALMATADNQASLKLTAAYAIKLFAFLGVSPSFDHCVVCFAPVSAQAPRVWFSIEAGGVVCSECKDEVDAWLTSGEVLQAARNYLYSPFADIVYSDISSETLIRMLDLVHRWAQEHMFTTIKSLALLLKSGMVVQE